MIEATHKPVNKLLEMEGNTVIIPHLGVSIRSCMGAALANRANFEGRRVKISYGGCIIGELRLKDQ